MTSKHTAVLVGIDFSEGSEHALERAVHFAQALGAELQLVHAYEPPVVTVPAHLLLPSPDEPDRLLAELQRLSNRVVHGKVPVTLHLRIGFASEGLLNAAAELHPTLIVVGSQGRGAVLRMLLGSTAAALIHRSPIPVLVEPPKNRTLIPTEPQGLASSIKWICGHCGRARSLGESHARCVGCGAKPAHWNSAPA